ncbi:MAG: hypothetical protein HYS13_14470 [Planctomycetia bacterium]|nr:hypothetical protein [Planctomycetia bacterium]
MVRWAAATGRDKSILLAEIAVSRQNCEYISGLLFLPEESAVPALQNGLLILASIYGLVVTRRVIAWAVARDERPRGDTASPKAAEVRDV